MNRNKLESLIVKATIALLEYSDFAYEKKCSLSPRLQAVLSLLKEIKKDDFNLDELSEYDFGALIILEEIKAVLAECGNGDPSLGLYSNEHVRMSFQFFLEKKGLLKEAEAFAMSRIKEFFPVGTFPQGDGFQVIFFGEGNENKKLEHKAREALREAYRQLNHYHLQVKLEGKQASPKLRILHDLLAQFVSGTEEPFLSDRKYICSFRAIAAPDFIYDILSKRAFGDTTLGIVCFWVTYAQLHEHLQHHKQLGPALVGLWERIEQFYQENVETLEECE